MRILFVSLPACGHMDLGGGLRVASFLQRLGHQVAWGTGYPLKEYVQRLGFEFHPVAPHKDVIVLWQAWNGQHLRSTIFFWIITH
jgi:hypothetical protein